MINATLMIIYFVFHVVHVMLLLSQGLPGPPPMGFRPTFPIAHRGLPPARGIYLLLSYYLFDKLTRTQIAFANFFIEKVIEVFLFLVGGPYPNRGFGKKKLAFKLEYSSSGFICFT